MLHKQRQQMQAVYITAEEDKKYSEELAAILKLVFSDWWFGKNGQIVAMMVQEDKVPEHVFIRDKLKRLGALVNGTRRGTRTSVTPEEVKNFLEADTNVHFRVAAALLAMSRGMQIFETMKPESEARMESEWEWAHAVSVRSAPHIEAVNAALQKAAPPARKAGKALTHHMWHTP
jgi:hypothetical protein